MQYLQHTSYIIHHTTSHIHQHTSYIIHYTSYIIHHTTSHIHQHTSYIIHHTSYIIHHTSYSTLHTSYITHHTSHTRCSAVDMFRDASCIRWLLWCGNVFASINQTNLWIHTHTCIHLHTHEHTHTQTHTHIHTYTHRSWEWIFERVRLDVPLCMNVLRSVSNSWNATFLFWTVRVYGVRVCVCSYVCVCSCVCVSCWGIVRG